MPSRPGSVCLSPGCAAVVPAGAGGWCDAHRPTSSDERGSAASRGYGARWRRLRRMILSRSPLCADPFGDHAAAGRVELATDVDHIVPRRDGGSDHAANLQTLCHSCHSRKTAAERARWEGGGKSLTAGVAGL
ncbi:MAG: HNH endonuclease [Flavobacteriales bacterium]|nr:HNH endonuclease [Flavobacteriales bacterium]